MGTQGACKMMPPIFLTRRTGIFCAITSQRLFDRKQAGPHAGNTSCPCFGTIRIPSPKGLKCGRILIIFTENDVFIGTPRPPPPP